MRRLRPFGSWRGGGCPWAVCRMYPLYQMPSPRSTPDPRGMSDNLLEPASPAPRGTGFPFVPGQMVLHASPTAASLVNGNRGFGGFCRLANRCRPAIQRQRVAVLSQWWWPPPGPRPPRARAHRRVLPGCQLPCFTRTYVGRSPVLVFWCQKMTKENESVLCAAEHPRISPPPFLFRGPGRERLPCVRPDGRRQQQSPPVSELGH